MNFTHTRSKKGFLILAGAAAISFVVLFTFQALFFPAPARADIAPPDQPPGANLLPGQESTQVRMAAESVLINVLANSPVGSLGQAKVTADFIMRNLGNRAEKMTVRFPLEPLHGYGDQRGKFPEIKDFSVRVNGRVVPWRRVTAQSTDDWANRDIHWAEFDVKFPPGQDVPIQVSYLTEGVGEYPFVSFQYILETGAGWRDTIGEADLTVRLPYEANNQNVIFDEQIGWSQTTPGYQVKGRDLQWKYKNLEPTSEDNLQVSLVMPSVWKKVNQESENTTLNPKNGEAWGRLGKLYKDIITYRKGLRQDRGGQLLYRLSLAAYEKALALLPKDPLWHAGLGDLYYRHYIWSEYYTENPNHNDMLRALEEFNKALALSPKNRQVLDMLENMSYAVPDAIRKDGDRYSLLWLTATPTPRPTLTPTPKPARLTPTP